MLATAGESRRNSRRLVLDNAVGGPLALIVGEWKRDPTTGGHRLHAELRQGGNVWHAIVEVPTQVSHAVAIRALDNAITQLFVDHMLHVSRCAGTLFCVIGKGKTP